MKLETAIFLIKARRCIFSKNYNNCGNKLITDFNNIVNVFNIGDFKCFPTRRKDVFVLVVLSSLFAYLSIIAVREIDSVQA